MRVKRAAIFMYKSNGRTKHITGAMREGFRRSGIAADVVTNGYGHDADIAVAYGWNHAGAFRKYRETDRPFIYIDLGYWNRRPKGQPREGHHRVAVNAWDTAIAMQPERPADRFNMLDVQVKPWKTTNSGGVLITGMSAKAALTHGFIAGQWEREAVKIVKGVTSRPINLRPKPISKRAAMEPIESVLARSYALVTHHSNTAVDAIVNGVPYYCVKGVAKRLSIEQLSADMFINPPIMDDAQRMQLLYDIAYTQWTPQEMRSGELWEYLNKCVLDFV